MSDFKEFLKTRIKANVLSLDEIAKCKTLDEAKPKLEALHKRDGFDSIEGFLRGGYDKNLSFGEEAYQYLKLLDSK